MTAADLEIIQSSVESFSGRLTVNSDLSNLSSVTTSDSAVWHYRDIALVVPPGATAELESASGNGMPSLRQDRPDRRTAATAPLATLGRAVQTRGRTIVTVRISPVAGDQVFTVVDFTVRFLGGARSEGRPVDDPHFDRILSAAVANWETARLWGSVKPLAASTDAIQSAFEHADSWFEVRTDRTGLCRITGSQLEAAGLSLSGLNSGNIRLFSGGGRPLPIDNQVDLPDMRELAIIVQDGGDGRFDASDAIIFYAEAVDRYAFLESFGLSYINNPYETENCYWLTTDFAAGAPAVRMTSTDGSPSGSADTTITQYERIVRLEQENLLKREPDGHIDSYLDWHWTDDSLVQLDFVTPGVITQDSARIFVAAATYSPYVDLLINGAQPLQGVCNRLNCRFTALPNQLNSTLNSAQLKIFPSINGDLPYLNYFEVRYQSELLPVNNVLDLTLGFSPNLARIETVDNFSGSPTIFDISDPMRPVIVTGANRAGGLLTFESQLSAVTSNRFHIAPLTTAFSPLSIEPADLINLRTTMPQSDLIIVTDERFIGALDEYVTWRESDGYSISVVEVEDIMTEFGFGLYDPTAIRDFLRYCWENLPAPAPYAVLLVGDGSYDYLDYLGTGTRNYVPPFILNRG